MQRTVHMNIYDFFNSPDVAEHCQSLGHTFNAVESAIMINQSDARTLAEKHEAYKAIIAEYPDMELEEALNHGHIKSFHKALGDILTYEEKILDTFLTPEPGAVYQTMFYYKTRRNPSGGELFTTFDNALSDAVNAINDDDKYSSHCCIYKKFPDSEYYINARVHSGKIIRLCDYGIVARVPRGRDDELELLESCCVDIPVPFKQGDLLEISDELQGGFVSSPVVCVLQSLPKDNPKIAADLLSMGDISDMHAGFFYEDEGVVACESGLFYPDLQYCRKELDGETRILKYMSLYLQDKICLCTLLKIQKLLLAEKLIDRGKHDHDLKYDLEQIQDTLLTKL